MSTDTIITPEPTTQDSVAYENYWGVEETFKFLLPDGKQYFEIKPMDEGMKTRFQKLTNKGIRMNQRTNDAHIDVDPADERHTLIRECVVDWNLMQPNGDGTFSNLPCPADESRRKREIDNTILVKFNPKFIQALEFFIRSKNPWMQADQKLEDLYEQRDQIDELIKQAKEREAGEDASANK